MGPVSIPCVTLEDVFNFSEPLTNQSSSFLGPQGNGCEEPFSELDCVQSIAMTWSF